MPLPYISFGTDNICEIELLCKTLSKRASVVRIDVHANALCSNGSDFWSLHQLSIDQRSE
jgi:hypothetical protein